VLQLNVLASRQEIFVWQCLVIVKETIKLANHPEVININWIFIDVLEHAELAFFDAKFESVAKVFISVYDASLFVFPLNQFSVNNLHWN